MKTFTKPLLLCITLLMATVIPAAAQIATLAWDQNTQPEVVGYKVYYRTDTPTFPFNGTTLSEGASPISINGATTTSLTVDLPEDGNIYYFTATAISDTGLESSFSDIIASEWIPLLIAPSSVATIDPGVTFTWGLPPSGYLVTYDLYYGTDPTFETTAAVVAPTDTSNSGWPHTELSISLSLAVLLSILLALKSSHSRRFWRPVRIGICVGIFAMQVSCGGGGDVASSDPAPIAPTPAEPLFTNVVPDITTTAYQVAELQPDTQYYWKIVAVDDQGFTYESLSKTFTTTSN